MTKASKRVTSVDEESFDPQRLDLYWRFLAERQRVYVRRSVLGMPFPWTADPILQAEFITNMYREMDPGTQYVIEEILEYEKPADVVFNVMMYRLMGSQRHTHEVVTQSAKGFDPELMISTLREHSRDIDFKVFGDAYRVAAYQDEKGADKIENVARMFGRFAKQMPETMRRIKAATTTREVFEVFLGLKGLGEFLAHQITVDLLYGDDPVVPFGEDEWAFPGPGARNGIWALLREDVKPANLSMVMEWLRDNQHEQFEKRGIVFPYLSRGAEAEGVELRVPLSLCNIQSTLCEYYKYVRLWTGEKTGAVRKYVPTEAEPPNGPAVVLSTEDLEALRELEPSLTPPPPSEEQADVVTDVVASDVEPAEEIGEKPRDLDGVSELQTFNITTPEGRQVVININFNFGS